MKHLLSFCFSLGCCRCRSGRQGQGGGCGRRVLKKVLVDLALAPVVRVRIPGPEGVRGSSWETLKPKRRWKVRAVAVFDDDCQLCCSTARTVVWRRLINKSGGKTLANH